MKIYYTRSVKQIIPVAMILTLLSGCEDPPPPQPPPVETPKTVEIPEMAKEGSRVEYVVEVATERTSNLEPLPTKSTTGFFLRLDVQRQADGKLVLKGNIPYVVVRDHLSKVLITWDTRSPTVKISGVTTGADKYIMPLLAMAYPNNSIEAPISVLKHITQQPLEVQLEPDGSYAKLNNYPSLNNLYALLQNIDKETHLARERRLTGMLGALVPQDVELLLCLLLPSRERKLADGVEKWQHDCPVNNELETLELTKEKYAGESRDVHYETRKFLREEDRTYQLSYSAVLGDWLHSGDIEVIRKYSKVLDTKQAGPMAISSTVTSKFKIRDINKSSISPDGYIQVMSTGEPGPYILYK